MYGYRLFGLLLVLSLTACTMLDQIARELAPPDRDRQVILTPQQPSQSLTSTLTTAASGHHDYTVITIDARAFNAGGTLVLEIRVGDGQATGSFDLLPDGVPFAETGYPQGSLARAYDLRPSGTVTLRHSFNEGAVFRLGAEGGWGNPAGTTNTFRLTATVAGRRITRR
jgi:hypothetical protein